MSDSRELKTMRTMAWERAKGELQALLHTYWGLSEKEDKEFDFMEMTIEEFIKRVEDNT